MAITIDLSPEIEAKLRTQAQQSGKTVEDYLKNVIKEEIVQPEVKNKVHPQGDNPMSVTLTLSAEAMSKLRQEAEFMDQTVEENLVEFILTRILEPPMESTAAASRNSEENQP